MRRIDTDRAVRHIEAESKKITTKQFDYLCGQAARRGTFYDRYKKGLVK